MDTLKIIGQKLLSKDKCVLALRGYYDDNREKCPGVLALVENLDGHCLFLYFLEKPSLVEQLENYQLLKILEIDLNFKYSLINAACIMCCNGGQSFTFHANSSEQLPSLTSELERARKIHSQNAVFASPSFKWIEKYTNPSSNSFKIKSADFSQSVNSANNSSSNNNSNSGFTGSLIQFEDTEVVDALSQKDWPFTDIMGLNVGQPCPVVRDTMVHSSLVSNQSSNNSLKLKGNKSNDNLLNSNTSNDIGNVNNCNNNSNISSICNNKISPKTSSKLIKSRSSSRDNLCNNFVNNNNNGIPNNSSSASITDPPIFHTKHRPGSREAIAQLLMKEREAEYTRLHNYRIFCGTWNVNGQPVAADLNEWLSPQKDDDPPDVYVLGLQEMDLSKNVYIFTESAKEDEWLFKFQSALHKKAHYKLVRCVRLVAIMLVVYVRDSVERHLRDICFESVGTGFFGTMGNKGGVAVRFKLRETSVCFINSHLAAHTEECERRNQDFRDINTRLFFRLKNQFISISEHDIVFWIGDLNYRISDIDTEDVKRMCSSGAYEDLLNFDQLSREMILKKVFFDFKEGAITFPPTFKYDPGTDEWDSSEKARTPAWCDRILWRGDNVRQICYRSHMQLKLSDHKPVSSVFIIGTKEFNREMEKQVRESVIKLLDQEENEFLPQVSLNMTDVYFKNLKYLDSQQQSLTIENIGQVPVKFKFINKPSDAYFCKPWLQVQPSEGFIHIGEKFIIQLEVQINSKSVPDWSSDKIEDILVLHLEGGKDFFITVTGSCLPSFFGLPLTKLVHMLKPVGLNKSRSEEPITKETDKSLGVPKELWFLVDYLYQRGMDQENLFQMLGLESEIKVIRDVLDETITGLSASTFHIHSVAETLLIFLDSLPTPVIPNNFYQECLNATSVQSCLRILKQLPVAHKNVFRYVCAFLREYLSHSDKNKSDVRILAHVFSGVLLKPPESSQQLLQQQQQHLQLQQQHLQQTGKAAQMMLAAEESNRKALFIQQFLENIIE